VLTIAWDVDDVLNDLMRAWFEREWLPGHPDCTVRYAAITENPPEILLGVARSDYLESLDRFRLSDAAHLLEPVPEVMDWFRHQGHRYRHMALTATPLRSAHITAEWVIRHYGNWIRSFHFVPSVREDLPALPYDRTKADFFRWWGKVDLFIDDNLTHIEAARKAGIKTLTMPRPWNREANTISGMLNSLTQLAEQPR
jgi:hypothetical protein